jgi:hypothetical protein
MRWHVLAACKSRRPRAACVSPISAWHGSRSTQASDTAANSFPPTPQVSVVASSVACLARQWASWRGVVAQIRASQPSARRGRERGWQKEQRARGGDGMRSMPAAAPGAHSLLSISSAPSNLTPLPSCNDRITSTKGTWSEEQSTWRRIVWPFFSDPVSGGGRTWSRRSKNGWSGRWVTAW